MLPLQAGGSFGPVDLAVVAGILLFWLAILGLVGVAAARILYRRVRASGADGDDGESPGVLDDDG